MIAQLGDLGYESFIDTDKGFKAYLPESDFSKDDFLCLSLFCEKQLKIDWRQKKIPPQNWNAQWERDFKPIRVGEDCLVRANFPPPENLKYELVITPKMSFGTGHHETTRLMMTFLLEMDCRGKRFLDMGTGTGVLSVLAEKKGAIAVHAIDVEPWCVENAKENILLNDCQVITTELGGLVPQEKTYDVILANINRNVLLDQIPDYAGILPKGGLLLMSGFYVNDLVIIQSACRDSGFEFICTFDLNDWIAVQFIKS